MGICRIPVLVMRFNQKFRLASGSSRHLEQEATLAILEVRA